MTTFRISVVYLCRSIRPKPVFEKPCWLCIPDEQYHELGVQGKIYATTKKGKRGRPLDEDLRKKQTIWTNSATVVPLS